MKVLVATDGSEHAMKAVQRALDLAKKENAEITLISVAYYAKEDLDEMLPDIQERLDSMAKNALNQAKALLENNGIKAEAVLESGYVPANNIIAKAKQGNFDSVLLGSTGSSRLKDILIGSTAAKVTAHAPCSVTIVR